MRLQRESGTIDGVMRRPPPTHTRAQSSVPTADENNIDITETMEITVAGRNVNTWLCIVLSAISKRQHGNKPFTPTPGPVCRASGPRLLNADALYTLSHHHRVGVNHTAQSQQHIN